MDQIRVVIHDFQHQEFSDYVGQVEFYPSADSFFTSFGYALSLRASVMNTHAQDLFKKLEGFSRTLHSEALNKILYAIMRFQIESDPIAYHYEHYNAKGCEILTESIKAILFSKFMKNGDNYLAKDVEDRKPVDIDTDAYFNALMTEIDIAIQLYKYDGTHRSIHPLNASISISLYADESLNWSVLIHQNEVDFSRTRNIGLLRNFPFVYGENRAQSQKLKNSQVWSSLMPRGSDLVLEQLIENLAEIADKQRIQTDLKWLNNFKKKIQEFRKLKPELKLRQLEGLENYLSRLDNCTHKNEIKDFDYCGSSHCVECVKEKIIRENIKKKAEIRCPCGKKK